MSLGCFLSILMIYQVAGFQIHITLMRFRIWIQLFSLTRIRVQLFTSMQIRIRILIKVTRICDHWPTDPPDLHFEPLHLNLEPRKLLKFVDSDPDPAFHSNADPDPASKKIGSRSGTEPPTGGSGFLLYFSPLIV
jgi:hypothetical protein